MEQCQGGEGQRARADSVAVDEGPGGSREGVVAAAEEAVLAVVDTLEVLGIPNMLVGSFSCNFYGIGRSTKDADFVNSFYLKKQPEKLFLISTGNITNASLDALILPNPPAIIAAFQISNLVELSRTALTIHT